MKDRYIPAEWESQCAIWLSWPCASHIWPGKREAIWQTFAELSAVLSTYQRVRINADGRYHEAIAEALHAARANMGNIQLFNHPNDDVWCRDHGPIWLREKLDNIVVVVADWEFNGWGGKFEPYALDDAIPKCIADSLVLQRIQIPYVLEGGAIDSNGEGVLLTTEPVLLNPNRGQGLTKAFYEKLFAESMGVVEIIWLPHGVPHDDTDGHVDNVARFFDLDAVFVVEADGDAKLQENIDILRSRFSKVVELPQVKSLSGETCFPASYSNFVIINGAVIVPSYGHPERDAQACKLIQTGFVDRDIIPFDCRLIVEEGGGLHCLSSNQFRPF